MSSTPATVALCVVTHQRPTELAAALASADGQGFHEVLVIDMASDPPARLPPGAVGLRSDRNVGYPAGRNRLAAAATAEVLVFLDDDAVLLGSEVAARVGGWFRERPGLGAVAGRILRPGGATASLEHPFPGPPTDVERARPCGYFVGAVHAVRRQAWIDAGGLDERFFYSTEEIDLSLALLQRGWQLRYEPELLVEHRPSAHGRSVPPAIPAMRARNRLLVARRHLPWPVALVHGAVWAGRTWREARATGDTGPWRRGLRDGLRWPVDRRPLSYRQAWRAHRVGARVLW